MGQVVKLFLQLPLSLLLAGDRVIAAGFLFLEDRDLRSLFVYRLLRNALKPGLSGEFLHAALKCSHGFLGNGGITQMAGEDFLQKLFCHGELLL